MTVKTKNCDFCKHWYYWIGADEYQCLKLHKPRFYRPKDDVDPHDSSWGWKRRCEDFRPKVQK